MIIYCQVCRLAIVKNPHESYKQFNKRITCGVKCQAELKKGKAFSGKAFDFTGYKHSEQTRKKNSEAHKGLKQTQDHIKNSLKARGFNYTPKEQRSEYRYFYNLKRNYGMSREDYYKMLESQSGSCAICGKENKQNRRLCVDHCHKTGKVRGILCVDCNVALGNVNDTVEILIKMIKYLKQ